MKANHNGDEDDDDDYRVVVNLSISMNESKSKCGISSLKLGKILGQKQIEDYELTVLEIVISKDFQSRINFAVLNQ